MFVGKFNRKADFVEETGALVEKQANGRPEGLILSPEQKFNAI